MERKFEEIYDVDDYEILTDSGWKDVYKAGKTIPYDVWHVILESGKEIKCADDHILFDLNDNEIYAKDLIENETYIKTARKSSAH